MKKTFSLLFSLVLLNTTLIASVHGQRLSDPIPEPITPVGVSVNIVDVIRMPDTRLNHVDDCEPQNQQPQELKKREKDRSCTNYARINFIRISPDGTDRWFVNDMRGPLYVVNGPDIVTYLNLEAEFFNFRIGTSFNAGFISFAFHPDFARNGKFYTSHTEVTSSTPKHFQAPDSSLALRAEGILTEWIADDSAANVFSGTRRELLRIALYQPGHHAFGEMQFNPLAQPGDSDYGLLYVALGDSGLLDPVGRPDLLNRRDSIYGSILRIDPLGSNAANGQYGIPATNPFANDPNAIGEIYAYGFRNPHRFGWDAADGTLVGIDTGQSNIEEVNLIHPGQNYGWADREGTFELKFDTMTNRWEVFPLPPGDTGYTYPVAQYDHDEGFAIAGGQLYRGAHLPGLHNTFVFGDIVSDRLFFADIKAMKNADDGEPSTTALISELLLERNGQPVKLKADLINSLMPNPYNRTDMRFSKDRYGEILISTKMDGYIRRLGPGSVHQTLQAEDASDLGGGVSVESNHNGHYGAGFVNFPSPPSMVGFIEWNTVDGGAGGQATLEVRYALGANTPRTVRFLVNGDDHVLTFEPTGSWNTWQLTPVSVTLRAGENEVRIQSNGQDSANIDELRVILSDPTPLGPHFVETNGTVVMEAEHFTGMDASQDQPGADWQGSSRKQGAVANAYVVVHDTIPGIAQWEDGAELSYTVRFTTAGAYHIWLRRWADDGGENSAYIGFDNQLLIGVDNGGNFNTWTWEKIATMSVMPGTHTVQLRRRESGYRVDRVLLTTDGGLTLMGDDGPLESQRVGITTHPSGTLLEAEDAAIISQGNVETNHPGFSGTGYVNYHNNMQSFVQWDIPNATSQAYVLAFRYANGSTQDRPLDISVNNVLNDRLSAAPTTSWSTWKVQTIGPVMFSRAGNTVRAKSVTEEGGPNVDYLDIAPVIEAEDAILISDGGAIENQHAGYTGTGYVNYNNSPGSFAEWAVTVPKAGTYMLTFRYANGSANNRAMAIVVNNSMAIEMDFPPTAAWNVWTLRRVEVTFNQGLNTIRTTSPTSQGGPNLDHIGRSFTGL